MTAELVAWLRECLDEDERVALAAAEEGALAWATSSEDNNWHQFAVADDRGKVVVYDEGWPSAEQAVHIARHDPARVLAEVTAKRRIIDAHDEHYAPAELFCPTCEGQYPPCQTLRLLASVYAGRPGWRSEWAPDEEKSS
jgi:hypothetical protein